MTSSLKTQFLQSTESHGYGYNGAIDTIRKEQYPQLKDAIYLDHAGATLPAHHLLQKFTADLTSNLYANPHSKSPSSQASSTRVESARQKILEHFKASIHGEWDVIFTANASAGIKLVGEAFPWTRRQSSTATSANASPSKLTILREAHTSLVGLRGLADDEGGSIDIETVTEDQLEERLFSVSSIKSHGQSNDSTESHHPSPPPSPGISASTSNTSSDGNAEVKNAEPTYNLFTYPAQCNFGGRRFPLSWTRRIKDCFDTRTIKNLVLLDAASYVMTSELDLSDYSASPDFVVVSFYKMFGFPTGLGAVIVKTELAPKLRKRYFGGGTVSAIASDEPWQVYRSSLHGRFEDGTLNFLDIVALDLAFESIKEIYGSYSNISPHVTALHQFLYKSMKALKHYNGAPLCDIYIEGEKQSETPEKQLVGNPEMYGPIINFNLKRSNGNWVGYGDVERLASMKNIHVRTGGFCNPGSMQRWLDLSADEVKKNLEAGHVCWDDTDILNGKPTGSIRVSLGAMSTIDDVLGFIAFLEEYFIDTTNPDTIVQSEDLIDEQSEIDRDTTSSEPIQVDSVIIYPIKSCRGYKLPRSQPWPIAPHGLLYDREWMLVDEVTGAAMTQKRYPRMCMIRAEILLEQNLMIVEHDQDGSQLSSDIFNNKSTKLYISLNEMPMEATKSSKVCGDCTSVVHYTAPEINEWFTQFLGKPCRLARQPVASQNPMHTTPSSNDSSSTSSLQQSSRFVKSHLNAPAGAPILLSNESPFLLIADKSVERVRDWVDEHDQGQGGVRRLANLSEDLDKKLRHELTSDSFRANFVTKGQKVGFEEDHWARIQIGQQVFDILGPCRRCHMVTIDQKTAVKNSDVFLALSKHRKSPGGQIFFGMHMLHRPDLSVAPYVVKVGDMIRTRREVAN
ncbi:pyridoxal phosphate-dependent transferase [Lobosporangium transversale]|uniref:Molybdenum cofactor sulfurase n=1 Tax=Lobosporangium transversale TaxID=64571 RepID=A0A1Y2GBC4_9FUNG|nr:pyridoxal phosphate-dependent transferase [Lobosporangium transversale]ORZ06286.1 pyridoxal phosphate-dependent transferase [Lobosporangium transversale]|eukprot:XP_021877449.1 pyridoxal phosphate-dependent transferase [Lobosporangium transversale]